MTETELQNMAYDNDNVFAKILRGEIPNHTIYEDAHCLAFMDVMPASPGHCLIIPKEPSVSLLDISADSLAHIMETVRKLAPSVQQAMKAEGLFIQQCNGTAGGQTVFHTHIHIIPRWVGTRMKRHGGDMADNALLAEQAALIKSTLLENGIS